VKHTKEAILSKALKLFNRQGFVNVRLQHIADAGAISIGHLAYHFKNKDAIIDSLYDRLKEQQEVLLCDFRAADLFENINQQLRSIFQLQKKYLFFYLDTLEVLRAYPLIREKHQRYIVWQLQQFEWMFESNIFRGSVSEYTKESQLKRLAWLMWYTIDNWMHARLVSGLDHLNEEDFLQDVWNIWAPYLTENGQQEFLLLGRNTAAHS
jgi:AcrR family transcriptional regulator